MKTTFISAAALALAAALTVALLAGAVFADDKAPALTVAVSTVSEQSIVRDIVATGNVVAWRDVPIGSEANGLAVTEIFVDEGDRVEKGQVLARLNSSVLTAQLAQQTAVVAELSATLSNAESDVRRARTVTTGVISAQTTEQRETLVKTTAAKREAAQASIRENNARIKQTEILAPAAGLISSRNIAVGQVVQTGAELFRMIQDFRIEVAALLPETDLGKVTAAQVTRVAGPNGDIEQGTVRLVAPVVDPKTRLGTVHIALASNTALKPGMFARVEIAMLAKLTVVVPLKALVWRQSKAGVFKVTSEGIARFTEVVIGDKSSDVATVSGDIAKGDNIVVEGAGLLNDGDAVRVQVAAAQSRGTAH